PCSAHTAERQRVASAPWRKGRVRTRAPKKWLTICLRLKTVHQKPELNQILTSQRVSLIGTTARRAAWGARCDISVSSSRSECDIGLPLEIGAGGNGAGRLAMRPAAISASAPRVNVCG